MKLGKEENRLSPKKEEGSLLRSFYVLSAVLTSSTLGVHPIASNLGKPARTTEGERSSSLTCVKDVLGAKRTMKKMSAPLHCARYVKKDIIH